MSAFLEQKRREIADRMQELEPAIAEYRQLEAASAALAGLPVSRAPKAPTTRRGAAARTTSRAHVAKPVDGVAKRRGRPPGSGARSQQALELVGANPGITIPEIAREMGIKQNYLYRVLPALEREGKVVKQDRGWHAAPRAAAAA